MPLPATPPSRAMNRRSFPSPAVGVMAAVASTAARPPVVRAATLPSSKWPTLGLAAMAAVSGAPAGGRAAMICPGVLPPTPAFIWTVSRRAPAFQAAVSLPATATVFSNTTLTPFMSAPGSAAVKTRSFALPTGLHRAVARTPAAPPPKTVASVVALTVVAAPAGSRSVAMNAPARTGITSVTFRPAIWSLRISQLSPPFVVRSTPICWPASLELLVFPVPA